MIKRKLYSGLKYLGVAAANAVLLTGLLALWTDPLEVAFHELVRPIECLKIIGVSALALLAMFLLTLFWRRHSLKISTKIIVASLLTMAISSSMYIAYSQRVLHNVITKRRIRARTAEKIKPSYGLAHGTKAAHLSQDEYRELAGSAGFPAIPLAATDIEYDYQYDGFLPDYSLDITYEVPRTTHVFPQRDSSRRYTEYQTVELVGDHQRVSYHEDVH